MKTIIINDIGLQCNSTNGNIIYIFEAFEYKGFRFPKMLNDIPRMKYYLDSIDNDNMLHIYPIREMTLIIMKINDMTSIEKKGLFLVDIFILNISTVNNDYYYKSGHHYCNVYQEAIDWYR